MQNKLLFKRRIIVFYRCPSMLQISLANTYSMFCQAHDHFLSYKPPLRLHPFGVVSYR